MSWGVVWSRDYSRVLISRVLMKILAGFFGFGLICFTSRIKIWYFYVTHAYIYCVKRQILVTWLNSYQPSILWTILRKYLKWPDFGLISSQNGPFTQFYNIDFLLYTGKGDRGDKQRNKNTTLILLNNQGPPGVVNFKSVRQLISFWHPL